MTPPDISIILPAYNAEKYISRILDEILSQTFSNYETIIINDGSTDATEAIIDLYAEKNKNRFVALHQKNAGVSAARNAGINAAKGKYLCFIDVDDEIKPSFLENLFTAAIENSSDLVIGGYIKVNGTDKRLTNNTFGRASYQLITNTRDIGVPFSKLYSTDIVNNHGIRFPVGMKLSEDAVFLYRYLIHSQRCTFIDAQNYIYYAPNSDSNKYGLKIEDEFIGFNYMKNAIIALLETLKLNDEASERLRQRLLLHFRRLLYAIIAQPRPLRASYYSKIKWTEILKYAKVDWMTKIILSAHLFSCFELMRILNSKIRSRNLESTFK